MHLNRLSKITAAAIVLAAATGCATVPGDPYYSDLYAPSPVYGGMTVYGSNAYPVYPGYPTALRDRDDRWENMRNDQERRAWRARQAERDRLERDHRRDWERQRDRDSAQRDRERERRERELAERQRQQTDRGNRNSRNSDGSPRTDYDRYNPQSGRWLPRSEDMP